MKINIATVNSGWILQKIAGRIAANAPEGVEFVVTHAPDYEADANLYLDIQNCYNGENTKLDICVMTHPDRNSKPWMINLLTSKNAYQLDGMLSFNERYTKMLRELKFPNEKLMTLCYGETKNTFPLKKVIVGIVSRGGYEGYGQQFMEQFFDKYACTNYKFKFLGKGWEGILPMVQKHNLDVELISDEDYSNYPAFYQSLDYLLIPGLWTAGPVSMQEALSTGIPVIGADVGVVNYEFKPDYSFMPGSVEELSQILDSIQEPILQRRAQVEHMSWKQCAQDTVDFIKKMYQIRYGRPF